MIRKCSGNNMEHQEKPDRKLGFFKRFLGIFGIRYPQEPGKWMLLTRRFRRIVLVLFLAVVALALIAVASIYYFKFVRVPSEGHFKEINVATETEPPVSSSEGVSTESAELDDMRTVTVGADSQKRDPPGRRTRATD